MGVLPVFANPTVPRLVLVVLVLWARSVGALGAADLDLLPIAHFAPGRITGLAADGPRVVAAVEPGVLVVVDVERDGSSFLRAKFELDQASGAAGVSGDLAVVMSQKDQWSLRVVDLRVPWQPVVAFTFPLPSDEWPAVTVAGHFAYVLRKPNEESPWRVSVVDLTGGEGQRLRGEVDFSWSNGSLPRPHLIAMGDLLFVAGAADLQVFDIRDPDGPRRIQMATPLELSALAVSARHVLVGGRSTDQGLRVFDFSDPIHPVEISTLALPSIPRSITVVNSQAVIALEGGGVQTVRLDDPENPALAGWESIDGESLVAAGSFAVLTTSIPPRRGADHLVTLAVDPPGPPRAVGLIETQSLFHANSVTANEPWVFVAEGGGIRVLNIQGALPGSPNDGDYGVVGVAWQATDGEVLKLTLNGPYLGAAVRGVGFQVFDIRHPELPRLLGTFAQPGILDAAVVGEWAYLVGIEKNAVAFQVVNVRDPAHPRLAATYPGFFLQVVVANGRAFLRGDEGVVILDVTDPEAPRQLGQIVGPRAPLGMAVEGHRACVVYQGPFLNVVDVSDPVHCQVVGTHRLTPLQTSVVMWGDSMVAVAGPVAGLTVLDLSDPAQPRPLGTPSLGITLDNLSLSGGTLWTSQYQGGVVGIDLTEPANPNRIAQVASSPLATDVVVNNGFAFVAADADGIQVWDLRNPQDPQPIATNRAFYATRLRVSGNLALVTSEQQPSGGVDLLDLGNPVATRWLGSIPVGYSTLGSSPVGAALEGTHAFVVLDDQLSVWDVSQPDQPRQTGSCQAQGFPAGVAVSGTNIVVFGAGLEILDGTELTELHRVGRVSLPGRCVEAVFRGDLLLVTTVENRQSHLRIIDLRLPHEPALLGQVLTTGRGTHLKVHGGYAYLAGDGGLEVFDIHDPRAPFRVGGNSAPARATGLDFVGDRALVVRPGHLEVLAPFVPYIRLEAAGPPDDDGFALRLRGTPYLQMRLQHSDDLRSWSEGEPRRLSPGVNRWTDRSGLDKSRRIYRAVLE